MCVPLLVDISISPGIGPSVSHWPLSIDHIMFISCSYHLSNPASPLTRHSPKKTKRDERDVHPTNHMPRHASPCIPSIAHKHKLLSWLMDSFSLLLVSSLLLEMMCSQFPRCLSCHPPLFFLFLHHVFCLRVGVCVEHKVSLCYFVVPFGPPRSLRGT